MKRLLPLLALLGCSHIAEDDFVSRGGISPDPTAILEGSVLYTGPAPQCVYKPDHTVDHVIGRAALLLFEYGNPPPPEGTATTAVNVMFVEGLFSPRDCLPEGASQGGPSITRSAAFTWPGVELKASAVDYQIRAFYDYDGDMNPLFSVTRLPTAGDVIGGALNDVRDADKGFFRIGLPRLDDAKNGLIFGGITVALGDVVRTQRPVFALNADRTLSSAVPFIPALTTQAGIDAAGSLRLFRTSTCTTFGADCGLSVQRLPASVAPALNALHVQFNPADPGSSTIFSAPIDVTTVALKSDTNSGVDQPLPDGKVDPHPILGAGLGIPWYMPALFLQRLAIPGRERIEATARIPSVIFVGSVLLNDDLTPTAASFTDGPIPMAVPPVAAVELIPGRAECRVPYFAPGTPALVTDGRLANCAPLPSGRYAASVLAGLAGGTVNATTPATFSDARYSGQSWTLPNELGDPGQTSAPVAGEGLEDAFVVSDSAAPGQCSASTPNGLCASGLEILETADGVDSVSCLRRECCDYVAHLCGLPRCAQTMTVSGASIASSPSAITGTHGNGAGIPDCVPFELPWQCCRPAP